MLRIKLSCPYPDHLICQTPGGKGIWGDCQFFENEPLEECDFWVVYENIIDQKEKTRCPPENTLLFTYEPPSIKKYEPKFLAQFNRVITCHPIRHPGRILMQQSLPWHVGRIKEKTMPVSCVKNYDDYKNGRVEKTKLLSIISSNKPRTQLHEKRYRFALKLKEYFGDQIDIFGFGYRHIQDKWDAIAPYRYHIVIENSEHNDYWTEKIADAYLGEAFPFYWGCRNLERYFDTSAFCRIDLHQPVKSIRIIEQALQDKLYENRITAVRRAKEQILDQYNLFAVIADYCRQHPPCSVPQPVTIYNSGVIARQRSIWIRGWRKIKAILYQYHKMNRWTEKYE